MIKHIKNTYRKAAGHIEFKKLLANFTWIAMDRVIRLGVGLFVVALIARYLGPRQYGNLSYAYSLTELIGILAALGTQNIMIRELVKNSENKYQILGTGFILRLFGGSAVILISIVTVFLLRPNDGQTQLLVILLSTVYLLSSLDVISIWFQSQIKLRNALIATNVVFVVITLLKVVLVYIKADLWTFAAVSIIEMGISDVALLVVYRIDGFSFLKWKWDWAIAGQLLKDSWPLIIASVWITIYMKIDQVMIGEMIGFDELGNYSAAARISEVWYFIPYAISSTLYPKIVKAKIISEEVYYNRLQKYFTIMALMSYLIIVPTFLLKDLMVLVIFGDKFITAGPILGLHIWSGLFIALGIARTGWVNTENLTKIAIFTSASGAIINILLNIPLIKWYGGYGAAVATLISYIIASYLSSLMFSKKIFLMQTRSLWLYGLFSIMDDDIFKNE